jgi:hypothetical protein
MRPELIHISTEAADFSAQQASVPAASEAAVAQYPATPGMFEKIFSSLPDGISQNIRKAGLAGAGAFMAVAAACGGGESGDGEVKLVPVTSTPNATQEIIVVSTSTPTPTKEVPPTPTKTAKEIAMEKMPIPVKSVYQNIEKLNETAFKGTVVTPEIVQRDLLVPIEKIQEVGNPDPNVEANLDFSGYLRVLSVLKSQFYAQNRNPEIQRVGQDLVRFLQDAYPKQLETYNNQTSGIGPDFTPPVVK